MMKISSTHVFASPHLPFQSSRRCHASSSSLRARKLDERFEDTVYLKMRGEAESPFRAVRLVLLGFSTVSASIGSLIATTQLIASLGHAPNAPVLSTAFETLGIDLAAVLVCGFFVKRDLDAQAKQLDRLEREERLGALPIELAGKEGKRMKLGDLRSFGRMVIIAGDAAHCQAAIEAAEPFRVELQARGVSIVPIPILDANPSAALDNIKQSRNAELASSTTTVSASSSSSSSSEDEALQRRWLIYPRRLEEWADWLDKQMGQAKVDPARAKEKGLYLSLRLDGRIRASGVGMAPWGGLAVQLPPQDKTWSGFLDGMDGVIRSFD